MKSLRNWNEITEKFNKKMIKHILKKFHFVNIFGNGLLDKLYVLRTLMEAGKKRGDEILFIDTTGEVERGNMVELIDEFRTVNSEDEQYDCLEELEEEGKRYGMVIIFEFTKYITKAVGTDLIKLWERNNDLKDEFQMIRNITNENSTIICTNEANLWTDNVMRPSGLSNWYQMFDGHFLVNKDGITKKERWEIIK